MNRPRPSLIRGLIAAGVITAGVGAFAGAADAHDFAPSVTKATCSTINGIPTKTITVTVTNQFAMHAVFTSAYLSATQIDLPASGQGSYSLHAGGSKVGAGDVDTVQVTWDDGFSKQHPVAINWGSAPCEGVPPTTTVPETTTTNGCPPGQHYSSEVPAGCYPDFTPPSTEVPVTAPEPSVDATTVPGCPPGETLLTFEDGSTKCDDGTYGGPPAPPASDGTGVAIVRPVATTRPQPLPATGSSSTTVIVAGLGALLVGAVLLVSGRRGNV